MTTRKLSRLLVLLLGLTMLTGCGALGRQAARKAADSIAKAAARQNDPETVRQGAAAFLLMADSLVIQSPEDPDALLAAANLYSAYGSAFVYGQDKPRGLLMSDRAFGYAVAAMSQRQPDFAKVLNRPYAEFEPVVARIGKDDLPWLAGLTGCWAAKMQAVGGDPQTLADLPKVAALARRMLALDETYQRGMAHLLMGVMKSMIPPGLGGKPEVGREHFERAIAISGGKLLKAKVLYARFYARTIFDRDLHDRLLREVLDTPADVEPDLTLANVLAKAEATELLKSADEYF